MISPNFYNKKRLVTTLLGGKVQHYPVKNASITIEWYDYIVRVHENLYTIASKVFGDNLEYMWTYIADNNPPRLPDDWHTGDIVRLPKIIIRDSDTQATIYSNATSNTTAIQNPSLQQG